jgi:hypothetical protein
MEDGSEKNEKNNKQHDETKQKETFSSFQPSLIAHC